MLLTGGRRPPSCPTGYFLEPTVFIRVDPTARIWTEEIFGPVLSGVCGGCVWGGARVNSWVGNITMRGSRQKKCMTGPGPTMCVLGGGRCSCAPWACLGLVWVLGVWSKAVGWGMLGYAVTQQRSSSAVAESGS